MTNRQHIYIKTKRNNHKAVKALRLMMKLVSLGVAKQIFKPIPNYPKGAVFTTLGESGVGEIGREYILPEMKTPVFTHNTNKIFGYDKAFWDNVKLDTTLRNFGGHSEP